MELRAAYLNPKSKINTSLAEVYEGAYLVRLQLHYCLFWLAEALLRSLTKMFASMCILRIFSDWGCQDLESSVYKAFAPLLCKPPPCNSILREDRTRTREYRARPWSMKLNAVHSDSLESYCQKRSFRHLLSYMCKVHTLKTRHSPSKKVFNCCLKTTIEMVCHSF